MNVVRAIYIPGVSIVIKNARYLSILVRVLFMYLESLSSCDRKKSFRKAGIIMANGLLSTSNTVLPFNREFTTLSGLSVVMVVGNIVFVSSSIRYFSVPESITLSISMLFNFFIMLFFMFSMLSFRTSVMSVLPF